MADNNRNRSNQFNEGWDQNRNRFNRDDDNGNRGSYGNYGNASSGRDYNQNQSSGSSDNLYGGNVGEGNYRNQYGTSGGYGNSNYGEDWGGNRNRGYNGGQNFQDNDNDRGWWDRTRDEVSSWFGDDDADRRRHKDQMHSGGHKGKGPKDYRRSEDRIREDVCDRLSDDDRVDATNIQVQVQGTEVILTGTVSDREQKRRAEDLVDRISGVQNVENRIRISRNESMSSNDYTGSSSGIGSGTTNEIIRNTSSEKSKTR